MLTRTRPPSVLDLFDVQSQVGALLNQIADRRLPSAAYPRISTWAKGNELILTAEIPGVDPQSVEVYVQNSKLTLSGSIATHEKKEDEFYIRSERRAGSFLRELELPFRVDSANVAAKCKNGILSMTLPRVEEDKIKKIPVTIA